MQNLSEKIKYLPLQPGCYLFKDKSDTVIYVGKAKNLRKIVDVDFIVTRTEVEALILENNLIKKYYPRYNIDLKDSRRYAYLKFHVGSYPWIEVVRKKEGEGDYYGPFV